jgi:hypothetical protein
MALKDVTKVELVIKLTDNQLQAIQHELQSPRKPSTSVLKGFFLKLIGDEIDRVEEEFAMTVDEEENDD